MVEFAPDTVVAERRQCRVSCCVNATVRVPPSLAEPPKSDCGAQGSRFLEEFAVWHGLWQSLVSEGVVAVPPRIPWRRRISVARNSISAASGGLTTPPECTIL